MSVHISLNWYKINNKIIAFYFPISRMVDWKLINDFLSRNFEQFQNNHTSNYKDILEL